MHVLIWSQPWPTQGGDLFFGLNSFSKALLLQAQALVSQKCKVTIAYPDAFSKHLAKLKDTCDLLPINVLEITKELGGWSDPSVDLYVKGNGSSQSTLITNLLRTKLPPQVDYVLLWETPAPYLKSIYPEAVIISQMPGSFARAPYPQTTIFDAEGLYRDGTMYKFSNQILASNQMSSMLGSFRDKTIETFRKFPIKLTQNMKKNGEKLTLLPLQITDHYAFKADTGFSSQAEFCMSALSELDPENPVVVTQYISNMYKDAVMTPDFVAFLREKHKNIVFDTALDHIPSVSQHILQDAASIAVATSGLALQSMIWHMPIHVLGETHLKPFDKSKMNTNEQRDRVLSFALTRNQPLASKLCDGVFLTRLLEETKNRRTLSFEERFPSFNDIDSNYDDTLLSVFRSNLVERDFTRVGLAKSSPSKAHQFSNILKEKNPELISFDLFDTLVIRGFEAPADLYRFVELQIPIAGLTPIFDFATKRLSAELAARGNADGEEISLDDIYAELSKITDLSSDTLLPYKNLEIETEINACRVRPVGLEMYERAIARGVPVVVTSDMYLPRHCIDAILDRSGYRPDEIYLSTEIGLTKKSGALFDYISKQRGVSLSKVVHIGDNVKTDIKPAEARKITAFHVPKSAEYIVKHPRLIAAFGRRTPMTGLARSVTAGAIAHKLFDDPKNVNIGSLSKGDPWLLGYVTLGPLLMGMTSWLRREATEIDIKELHFLSREGKILKDAFDRVALSAATDIRTNYLYGSRRAIRVAQLKCFQDISELASQTIDSTATLEALLTGRFGLKTSMISEELLNAHGYKGKNDKIGKSVQDVTKLKALLKALEFEILDNASREAATYTEYLRDNGLFSGNRFAIVDVGWNANMQGSLGQILGKPITGFYLASLDAATRWKSVGHTVRAYMGEDFTSVDRNPILANRLMLENILCDTSSSVERMEKLSDGTFEPVYIGSPLYERTQLVGAIQRGALAFVDEICRTLGSAVTKIDFQPDIATPLISDFLASPTAQDAELFVGAEIEDAFSGAASRYYLAPKNKPNQASAWKAGEVALQGKKIPVPEKKNGTPSAIPQRAAYKVPIVRKPLVPIVRVFVSKIGNENDVFKYNADPSAFFSRLKNPWYRRIGNLLFPAA